MVSELLMKFQYVGTYLDNYSPSGRFDLDAQSNNNTSIVTVDIDELIMLNNYSYWMQFSRNPVRFVL